MKREYFTLEFAKYLWQHLDRIHREYLAGVKQYARVQETTDRMDLDNHTTLKKYGLTMGEFDRLQTLRQSFPDDDRMIADNELFKKAHNLPQNSCVQVMGARKK